MELFNFEKSIPQKILTRGRRYYRNGMVIALEEEGEGEWSALVTGSEHLPYRVQIELEDYDVRNWSCNCPFSTGPVCRCE